MMEKIQIVTPVYNEEKNIYTTIENFFKEYSNNKFEISFIISEDGSTDNSINIINELKKIYDIKLLNKNGIIIIHRNRKDNEKYSKNLSILEEKTYGISKILFGILN